MQMVSFFYLSFFQPECLASLLPLPIYPKLGSEVLAGKLFH
jgi:hypothetical protein